MAQLRPKTEISLKFEDDYVTKSIGAFGLWQFILITIASLVRLVGCWNSVAIIFLAPHTEFFCKSFSENETIKVENNTCYKSCKEYAFVRDVFDETTVTEFNLICDDAWLASLIQSMMMFGILSGVSFYGWFSDRYGRSRGIVVCCMNSVVFSFATAFCPTYWTVAVMRFLTGFGSGGIFSLTAVYFSEIVGTKLIHTVICAMLPVMDAMTLITLTGFAYFTASWRNFILAYSTASLAILAISFLLPETPRWLIAKKKPKDAIELMTRAAKFNNVETHNLNENVTKASAQINLKDESDLHMTYLDLFRTRKLAIWTIAMFCVWVCTGFTYFGLLQYASQFGSNLYIAVPAMGLSHLIVAPISVAILRYFGRRSSCIFIFAMMAVTLIALIFTPKESTAGLILGTFGSTAATTVFAVIYVYVVELYPTPMRNMGLSFSSVGSKGAAIISPFVANLDNNTVVSLLFAVMSISAALFCLQLPETKGKSLKDTVDDIE